MLRHASSINHTVKGLGAIIDNQSAVVRFLIRNWAITSMVGVAYGVQLIHRYRKKDLNWFGAVSDLGSVLMPAVALFTIQQLAREDKVASLTENRLASTGNPQTLPQGMNALPVSSSLNGPPLGASGPKGSQSVHVVKQLA